MLEYTVKNSQLPPIVPSKAQKTRIFPLASGMSYKRLEIIRGSTRLPNIMRALH